MAEPDNKATEAETKGAESGGDKTNSPEADKGKKQPPPPPPPPAKAKAVRVLSEGTLGPKLLTKGTITSDPEYVAILEQKGQKKVELVK